MKKIVAGITFALAMMSLPALAYAATGPSPNGHYYGVAQWNNATTNEGAYADLYISSGSAADYASGGHINQTVWEGTNYSSTGSDWVEGGYTYGYHGANVLTYYWAQNNPTTGYSDHRVTSTTPTVGNWEPVEVYYIGNDTWDVDFDWSTQTDSDGTHTVATGQPPYSNYMATGVESTSSSSTLSGAYSSGMEYENTSGTWSSAWGSGTGLLIYTPAEAAWTTTNAKLHDWQN
ncbi:hypothetical protein [Alicyclobacillus sp. ALC3]|uniref:hypothetical protein n=1 Tax=Alicyclobacillus sp. ALC3 TaxID=2796143 RepID=UPI002379282E|nr:hypothetical protein [Alicyclobacillus sp. ALC3]WDL99695.1 hypothetical protein JC200_23950 [Alicyclobacillus sp. ALC3]